MEKEHLKTIKKVEKFIKEKNFEGLRIYIEQRKSEIEFSADDASEYMEKLIKDLN